MGPHTAAVESAEAPPNPGESRPRGPVEVSRFQEVSHPCRAEEGIPGTPTGRGIGGPPPWGMPGVTWGTPTVSLTVRIDPLRFGLRSLTTVTTIDYNRSRLNRTNLDRRTPKTFGTHQPALLTDEHAHRTRTRFLIL